jgi:predicted transcriptional regulator
MLSKTIRAHKEANPQLTANQIAATLGTTSVYVSQVLHKAKKKAVKAVKPVVSEGQSILREEIKRLNEDLDGWRELYLSAHQTLGQLEQDVIGYRAVISYLQGQLDGITV